MRARSYIVMPVYNEAKGIRDSLHALVRTLESFESDRQWKIVLVNDGSTDGTTEILERWLGEQVGERISRRVIHFTRNFGFQPALVAGLIEAANHQCEFAVTMDADGEHPPEVIPQLVQAWLRTRSPIVHTVRLENSELGMWKRLFSRTYYRILQRFTDIQVAPGMADFKLWDGKVLGQVKDFLPSCGSTRIFAAWLAPSAVRISFKPATQVYRKSHFNFRRNLGYSISSLLLFSQFPLRFFFVAGLTVMGAAFAMGVSSWLDPAANSGWTTSTLVLTLFGGFDLCALGLLAEYLVRYHLRKLLPSSVRRTAPPLFGGRSLSDVQVGEPVRVGDPAIARDPRQSN